MSIGSRIKEARYQQGLTQEELAKAIGVTKGAIANYENEVSTPKIELLYKLFAALHCDAKWRPYQINSLVAMQKKST